MNERVRLGQTFEHSEHPGSVFTIVKVQRGSGRWNVSLLCLIPGKHFYRFGQITRATTVDGTLSLTPFVRIA